MEVQTCGKPLDALLERVLCTNILSSDYFKELYSLKTYTEVVDEIYNQVDHVEPWMTGNCRGPSTAFCLLYKLFTMKFSVKQMQGLLDHGDSPYIRAIGFLYLRYVGDPKTLWGWFEQYVTDDEEFAPGSNGRMTTMGVYVRDLLLNQYYFDTLFPRIPVPILRQITAHLERMKLSTQPAGVTGAGGRHGGDDTARRPPSVKAALSVSFGQRAPHRAFTRDSSPIRRSVPVHEPQHNGTNDVHHSKRQERVDVDRDSRDRDRERSRDSDRERDRRRTRDVDAAGRDRDRDREHDQERERLWDRERERERSRDRDREDSRGRGREDRDRDSNRDSRFRDGGNEKARGRDRERERENGKSRERREWSGERDRRREREKERQYEDIDHRRSHSPRGRSSIVGQQSSQSPTNVKPAFNNLKKLLDVYGDASDKKICSSILAIKQKHSIVMLFLLDGVLLSILSMELPFLQSHFGLLQQYWICLLGGPGNGIWVEDETLKWCHVLVFQVEPGCWNYMKVLCNCITRANFLAVLEPATMEWNFLVLAAGNLPMFELNSSDCIHSIVHPWQVELIFLLCGSLLVGIVDELIKLPKANMKYMVIMSLLSSPYLMLSIRSAVSCMQCVIALAIVHWLPLYGNATVTIISSRCYCQRI